ncbi:MAG: MFS transporter [Patescibacteria group bacterium]
METVSRVAFVSHFLLMFGYKLFSFFFPLYLVKLGLSLPAVGYTYLLIYLPIALFAPVVGALNSKTRPIHFMLLGIAGYAAYSLVMMAAHPPAVFYVMQVVLGLSAACFFVSVRSLLARAELPHLDRTFGYFYAAPNAAEVLAPAVGAAVIFFFGFPGVFLVSLAVHLANILYVTLQRRVVQIVRQAAPPLPSREAYREFGKKVLGHAWPLLLPSFVVLVVGGIYQPFFVLFLEHLGWSQNMILLYGAVFSALFVPISWVVARYALQQRSSRNVYGGSLLYAAGSFVFGILSHRLEFVGILTLAALRGAGALSANSGRSAFLSRSSKTSEPAAVIDTMLSPLGTAFGALAGGYLLTQVDFGSLFTQAGALVAAVVSLSLLFKRSQ